MRVKLVGKASQDDTRIIRFKRIARSQLGDGGRLETLRTTLRLIFDAIALIELLEPLLLNNGVMHEYIIPTLIRGNESISFACVEEFHRALCHFDHPSHGPARRNHSRRRPPTWCPIVARRDNETPRGQFISTTTTGADRLVTLLTLEMPSLAATSCAVARSDSF